MIIECDLPFHVIQKDAFKNFCTTLDPKYYVPSNRKMIKLAGAISAELTLPSGRNKACTSIIFRDGHMDEKGVYVLVSCNNVTVCFFNPKTHAAVHAMLNLFVFSIAHPHTLAK